MDLKEILFKALLRRGHSIRGYDKRVWDIAERTFLYLTPELVEGFLNLHNHERYKEIVLNKEVELLKKHIREILKAIGTKKLNLFDVGCGDGLKAKTFIEAADGNASVCYYPMNVSEHLVNLTLENVKKENFKNMHCFKPLVRKFEELEDAIANSGHRNDEKNVVLLLDSLLASYEINDYLFRLSEALSEGDYVLIGNGIRKGKRFENIDNYKSPLFDKWFIPLIKELGVDENDVVYDARFEHGRVEGFYRFKKEAVVEHEGREIKFRTGDEIVVAVLYKYFPEELEEFCDLYFSDVKLIKDKDDEYALIICRK